MAGHLALKGHRVRLYDRNPEKVDAIKERGGIKLEGAIEGFSQLELVTSDLGEAIKGAEVVMLVVPATAHRPLAKACAPHLTDGQIIVLNPGRTGGALEFYTYASASGRKIVVAEAQTLLYACRSVVPGLCHVYGVKNAVPVAALPGFETPFVVQLLQTALPQFVPGDNVLKTSLDNIGAVFHPAVTVLNSARIECGEDFEFYTEGVTPAVAEILEEIDQERVNVAAALGLRAMSAREWLYVAYGASGTNLYQAIQANTAYNGIKAPKTINHRYITEDVPMSLVPLASLGDTLGVPTPAMKNIIFMASLLHGVNYWEVGRTAEDMGLADLDVRSIRKLVMEGGDVGEKETA